MALRQVVLQEHALDGQGQLQDAHLVRDRGLVLPQAPGQLVLGEAVIPNQVLIALRLLHVMQVFPLQVLHHGDDRAVLLVGGEHDRVDRRHAGHAAGAQPSLPRDELVGIVPRLADADGLQKAVLLNGSAEFLQRLLGKDAPRLIGIGANGFDGNPRDLPFAHPEVPSIHCALCLHTFHSISCCFT